MITKLIHDDEEIGEIGENNDDPRHPGLGAIIDGPEGRSWTVVRILENDPPHQAAVEVEPFVF